MKLLTILTAAAMLTATAAHAQSWGYGVNGFAQGLAQGLAITSGVPYYPPPPAYYPPPTYYVPPPIAPRAQNCTGYTDLAGYRHVNCY